MNSERKAYDQAHFLVLEHMELVEPYVLKHKQLIVQQNPGRGEGWVAKKHMKEFNNWFKDRVQQAMYRLMTLRNQLQTLYSL